MSKGSKQRPTDKSKFDEGWDRIFGKKDPVKKNMDKFHKPATHVDQKKEGKKYGKFTEEETFYD